MNQLADNGIIEQTGLIPIVFQPTRQSNILDRIYVSDTCYSTVRVVKSMVISDHHAVVAYHDTDNTTITRVRRTLTYRKRTPTQHALFLAHIATLNFDADDNEKSVQRNFDDFYETLLGLLEAFYPERTITVSNRDPDFITADIKRKLRRKNRLMRAARVEEASALAIQIAKDITRRNARSLNKLQASSNMKEVFDS